MAVAYKVAAGFAGKRRSSAARETVKENPWEPYTLKVFPKHINGRWYFAGDTVYRRQVLGPGGVWWKYGDEFDYLRWTA